MNRTSLVGLTLLFLSALIGRSADSVWEKLDESTYSAFRFHLTQEQIQSHQAQFPALFSYWQSLSQEIREYIHIKDQKTGESIASRFETRNGFKLEDLLDQLSGEFGLAIQFEFDQNDLDEFAMNMVLWITPDNDTETLFSQIKAWLETNVRNSDTSTLEKTSTLEEVSFVGHKGLYYTEITSSGRVSYQEDTEEVSQRRVFSGTPFLLVATDKHLILQISFNFTDNEFSTSEEVAAQLAYNPQNFAYLGNLLQNNNEGRFIRQFTGNPAFQPASANSSVCDVAVNIIPFVQVIRVALNELAETELDPETPSWLSNLRKMDWLAISGLSATDNFYGSLCLTSNGMESLWGLGGTFSSPNPNNFMRIVLDKPTGGVTLPGWIPDSAVGAGDGAIKLGEFYDFITEQLALHLGADWNDLLANANTSVQAATGMQLEQYFHTFGEHVYSIAGEAIITPKTDAESDSDFAPIFIPQVYVFEIKDAAAARKLLEQVSIANLYLNGMLQQVNLQGFNGWQMKEKDPDGQWLLVENGQYLVLANHEDFTLQVLSLINRSSASQSGFMQRPEVQKLIRLTNLQALSFLQIDNSAQRVKELGIFLNGSSKDQGNNIKDAVEDFTDDEDIINVLRQIVAKFPWEEVQKELGYAITTGELVGSEGFLMHKIQTSALSD